MCVTACAASLSQQTKNIHLAVDYFALRKLQNCDDHGLLEGSFNTIIFVDMDAYVDFNQKAMAFSVS